MKSKDALNTKFQITSTYWSLPQGELLLALHSELEGLSSAQAIQRLTEYGPNVLKAQKKTGALGLFLNQFKSPIIIILLLATAVSAIVKDWADALIIFAIVLGSAVISFYQEYSASNAAEELRAAITYKTKVIRDGQEKIVLSEEIVPGDVILLSAGNLIPADGIVLQANDFYVSQAVLTGETFPVEKKTGAVAADASLVERINTVYMGTNVRSGQARALVVKTGSGTAFGEIAARLSLRPPETEFEQGIRHLGYLLAEVMFILVIGIFAFNVYFHKPVLDSLLFSIALAVGLTPQLLPAVININLSKGSQAMAKRGVIVRRLASIENFGSMDVLCTDKTGTLTEGIVELDESLDVQSQKSQSVFRLAYINASLQTGITIPLDQAITSKHPPDLTGINKLFEIPYDFERKRLSLIVQDGEDVLLITKGALELVLSACTQVAHDQHPLSLEESLRKTILKSYLDWSADGFRVLGVASRIVDHQSAYSVLDEHDLIFNGFLLFCDPPKPGVHDTILELERLGVNLKIITGDNKPVAFHIAQAIGMVSPTIMTGAEIEKLHNEALWHAVEKTKIFAEVDPNQKEHIILALKKTGHVVGYMGDGINDAPALHSADVGLSVENAVDVAKEAADLVLLKQDLTVLKEGILLGRKTFANTLKYVFMATSANFGNMFSVAVASLFLPFLPMLPKQILLINFLTDMPEMTIAGDNVDQAFLECPRRWDIGFIRKFMFIFGGISSIFDILTFALLLWGLHAGQEQFHTGWFVESVLSATLVVFALRTRLPFQRSKPSRTMLAVTVVIAFVTLYLPYSPLNQIMGFRPLPSVYLLCIAAIVLAYFVTAEIAKRWFYRRFWI